MPNNPLNKNTRTPGQSIPGNYGFNLNSISRQSPTGKFINESFRGQGMGDAPQGAPSQMASLQQAWSGGNLFGNEVFSGSGGNVNTGISNLNKARLKR